MQREQGSLEFNQGHGESSSVPIARAGLSGVSQGQPTKDYERTEFCHIHLDATLMGYLRRLGGGDVSQGVAIAGRLHQAMHSAEK
jgi:hypothetical protein